MPNTVACDSPGNWTVTSVVGMIGRSSGPPQDDGAGGIFTSFGAHTFHGKSGAGSGVGSGTLTRTMSAGSTLIVLAVCLFLAGLAGLTSAALNLPLWAGALMTGAAALGMSAWAVYRFWTKQAAARLQQIRDAFDRVDQIIPRPGHLSRIDH